MENAASDDSQSDVSTKSSRQRKEVRRPDMAIYKPGQSRLGKRSEQDPPPSTTDNDTTPASSIKNIQGDHRLQDTSKAQSQKPKPTQHGDKGQELKQPPPHQHGKDKREGRSSVHLEDRKSTSQVQRSGRDNKRSDNQGNRSSRGNKVSHPRSRPDHDSSVRTKDVKKETGSYIKPAAKPPQDRNAGDDVRKEGTVETKSGPSPESKPASEQQPQVQREKRWHGPQGKRKNAKDDTKTGRHLGSVSKKNSERVNIPIGDAELASDSSLVRQADSQTEASTKNHNWLGKQENHNGKAPKRSQSNEKAPSSNHHGNHAQQTSQESKKTFHGSKQHSHQEDEAKRSHSISSETILDKVSRQKKPDRSFYVSPKLAGSQGQDEPKTNESETNTVPPEDKIETMVFTSRKSSNQNWSQRTDNSGSKNSKPADSLQGKFTLENNKKVPLKSLLDLQVSPPGKGMASKTPKTELKSQNEAKSPNADTRSKPAPSSKRYSARRSRQRYNSESSTGSDNSQFVDVAQSKSEDLDRDLAHTDSKLQNLSLKDEFKGSYESISSTDSGKRVGTALSQKKTLQSQNQRRHLDSRADAEVSERQPAKRETGKQVFEKGKLTVTFNSNVREVTLSPEEERERRLEEESQDGRSGDRRQSGRNRHRDRESRRTASESEETQSEHASKGGGLIRLPQKRSDPISIHSQPANQQQQQSEQGYRPIYDRYYNPPQPASEPKEEPRPKDARGRPGNRNLLWDPSKPQERPALASAKKPESTDYHFYDPEQGGSPGERKFDPRGHFQPQGYGAFYPPAYPAMPVQHTVYPSPGFYPAMSWAEQVEAHNTDSKVQAPSPPTQVGNYQGNFPPLGASPDAPMATETPTSVAAPPSSHSHSVAHRILQDTARYEHSINNAVSRRFHGEEGVQKIMKLSQELERMYEQVILTDLEMCNKHNIEQLLWKTAYYQVIEALRRQDVEEPGTYKLYLEQLLDHGDDFYVSLLEKLQSAYSFRLETRTGLDPLHEEPRRAIKLALLSAQRCMISLGDIARYKELTNDTSNYGKARSWYLKAQHLAPRNGRPYNQLAILALYTRRKLDAVYYYMRSLAASNPFLTARESLMSLFEEVRRKVEHKEKAQVQAKEVKERAKEDERRRRAKERRGRRSQAEGGRDDSQATRREIWIASDGSSHDGSELAEDNEEEDGEATLRRISPVEINKRFVLSLLNVHGKLFTKIGMEHFSFIAERLLKEFRVLLTHTPTPVTSTRIVQAMAINMFAAHNTETKDQSPREDLRSLLQEQAIQLGLDMFGLLVSRCNQLLTDHLKSDTQGRVLLSEDLLELLPGVKVYADWLMCHPQLWNPPPSCTDKPYSASVDVWSSLAELLNTLKRIDTNVVTFIKKTDENGCQEILLPEDVQLSGFVPLIALPLQPVYIPSDTNKLEAMDCVRINSLLLFGEYACGQETPLLAYDVSKNCYISVAPELVTTEKVEQRPDQADDDVIIEEEYYEDAEESSGKEGEDSGDVSSLRQKKEDLERRLQQQQQKQAQIQATMESHRQQLYLEVEIRPLYLVPDTNCFIDHLSKIQALLACRKYKLVVPLVVINELDGLAKGSRDDLYEEPSQALRVQEGAGSAIRCLEEKFGQRNKYLRALTSKGTVMDTIAYRSEEVDFKGCNDDLILKCCLHYVDDRARDFMPTTKDAPIRLYRDVVLLTNDRNLRVKALQQNVPVKDITAFAKWAKV
ncbi:telomerase-binding protein EST1A-like [Acanthaster planci]|uniref:Telomerase-binding protein EST1A-like n=1 Tax=Acanthaster planci TaxID=133434 RepID=A0A8B7ZYL9_ACAPL|nr:telomerase-binding protein EST1A-like [Acanthaster planci]XP_022110509.1 telomerase-binding protein EST1A-like [Acanthaster planci]